MAEPRTRGLHQWVIEDLGQRIADGVLAVGDQIVPEEVGARLGVSRTVVREAMRDLQAKGMIIARPKTGTRVLPATDWNLLDAQVIGWRVRGSARQDQLRDLLELRSSVEMSALRLVAARAGRDDTITEAIATLMQQCDLMEAAVREGESSAFTDADVTFHATVLTASGNLIFRQFTTPIGAALRALDDLEILPDELDLEMVQAHREVARALEAGDGDRAVAVTTMLITNSRREIGLRER